jgi:hypothetical protein
MPANRLEMPQQAEDSRPGDILLNLDRPRRFRLDLEALQKIKGITGQDALSPEFFGGSFKLENFIVFLWAGLRGEDPGLTMRQAAQFCRPAGIAAVLSALRAARASGASTGKN